MSVLICREVWLSGPAHSELAGLSTMRPAATLCGAGLWVRSKPSGVYWHIWLFESEC